MIETEKREFKKMLVALLSLPLLKAPKNITPEAAGMYWGALKHKSFEDIRGAINRHLQNPDRGRFYPVPADIIYQLPAETRLWIDAEEAWALIPKNEASSSVMCDEMAEALGVAEGLLSSGDMIAARMAFKSAYTRLIDDTKREGRKPRWWASMGHDLSGRESAEIKAVEMNNLSLPAGKKLALPKPESTALMSLDDVCSEVPRRSTEPAKALENIKRLKSMLAQKGG